jgi:hypothetical protein
MRSHTVPGDGILHTVGQRVAEVQLSRHIGGRDHHREYTGLKKKKFVYAFKNMQSSRSGAFLVNWPPRSDSGYETMSYGSLGPYP